MLKGKGLKGEEKWKALLLLIRELQDDLLNISSYHGMAVWWIFREKSGCQSKETTQSIKVGGEGKKNTMENYREHVI